jgi:hypothetical protein
MPTTLAPILVMKPRGRGQWRPATANDGRRLAAIMRRREFELALVPVAWQTRSVAALVAICEHMGVEVVFRPGKR